MVSSIPILFLVFDLFDLISSVENDTLLISNIICDLLLVLVPNSINFIIWFILRIILYCRGLFRRFDTINMIS